MVTASQSAEAGPVIDKVEVPSRAISVLAPLNPLVQVNKSAQSAVLAKVKTRSSPLLAYV